MKDIPTPGTPMSLAVPERYVRRVLALHEAGHAVVGYYFGNCVTEGGIRIDVDTGCGECNLQGGLAFFLSPLSSFDTSPHGMVERRRTEKLLRAACIELMAGGAAEMLWGSWDKRGQGGDACMAIELIRRVLECDQECAELALWGIYFPAAKRLVKEWDIAQAIFQVAEELEAMEELGPAEADELLESGPVKCGSGLRVLLGADA